MNAQTPDDPPPDDAPPTEGLFNMATKTLGGKQFWADRRILRGWRIQQHALTGHHRLLDPHNHRHAWGSWDHCLARLNITATDQKLAPVEGKVVIVLHGLFRTRSSIAGLGKHLAEQGGFELVDVGYPTTRATVAWHARNLATVIEGLPEADEIYLVAHSLGNLVIRHWVHDQITAGDAVDPRIKRMVMLGPPNNGAEIAEKLVPLDITRQFTGPAAQQLARDWKKLEPQLATPPFEFGIIAGGAGKNPLVTGEDDWVVTVESTRLPGARDFRVLPVAHTTMMNDPTVREYTLRFLQQGFFESEDTRQPIDRTQKSE